MDEELILQLIQEVMGGAGPAEPPPPDPRQTANALFLSRLAQQDVTAPSRFTPREGPSGFRRATDFTSFADLGDILGGIEERDPAKVGGALLLALLGTAGATGIGRRFFRGRRAARAADVAEDAPLMTRDEIIDDWLQGGGQVDDLAQSVRMNRAGGRRGELIEDFLTGGRTREAVEVETEAMIAENLIRKLLEGR